MDSADAPRDGEDITVEDFVLYGGRRDDPGWARDEDAKQDGVQRPGSSAQRPRGVFSAHDRCVQWVHVCGRAGDPLEGGEVAGVVRMAMRDKDVVEVQATMQTLIPLRPTAPGAVERGDVDVDDFAIVQIRLADGALGIVEVSRMATGSTNDLRLEIFGESGALRVSMEDPSWLYIYDARDPEKPLGGTRGTKRLETLQRFEGQVSPDWTQPMGFVRSHAECEYQFLKAIWEDRQPRPDLHDGVYIQRVMAAAERSAAETWWVGIDET
jgi:predicted dehydrogenase